MRNALRFLGALLLGLLLLGGAVGLGLFLLLQGEEALARELSRLARERLPLLLFALLLFLMVLAALLHPLFLGYLVATRALGQEALALLANPGHRLSLRGPLELQALARLIQRLAEERAALEKEVAARVAEAKALLERERGVLSASSATCPKGWSWPTPRARSCSTTLRRGGFWGRAWGWGRASSPSWTGGFWSTPWGFPGSASSPRPGQGPWPLGPCPSRERRAFW